MLLEAEPMVPRSLGLCRLRGTKMEHLDDNLLAVEVCLSAEDLREIDHAFATTADRQPAGGAKAVVARTIQRQPAPCKTATSPARTRQAARDARYSFSFYA